MVVLVIVPNLMLQTPNSSTLYAHNVLFHCMCRLDSLMESVRHAIMLLIVSVKAAGNADLSPRSDPHHEFCGLNCLIEVQTVAETAASTGELLPLPAKTQKWSTSAASARLVCSQTCRPESTRPLQDLAAV